MKESFQPEKMETKTKEKKTLWRTLTNIKNAAAFAALLAFAAPAPSSAGEKEPSPENNSAKIAEILKTKGREGKFGQTAVRRWVSENKDTVVVGYESDGKPRWLISESEGAGMRFFDMSADGSVNRIILNNSRDPAQRKAAWNDQATFKSMENLAKEARVEADLMPKEVNVYEIVRQGETYLRGVDFEKGESEKVIGPEAKKLAERVQNLFNQKVAEHSAELSK